MGLVDAMPRQPTRRDLDDCDEQIRLWRGRQVAAPPGTAWASACANVVDEWLELRSQLTAVLPT